MQHTKPREELLKLPTELYRETLFSSSIVAIDALNKLGVGGLEEIGLSDKEIYAWLSSPTAAFHRNQFGGDIKSVLLANRWDPDRHERAMRSNIPNQQIADIFAESYRKAYLKSPFN